MNTPQQHPTVAGDTVGALVESGAQCLAAAGVSFGHGTTNAHDEAAWLVLWRLGLPLDSDLSEAPDSMKNQPVAPADQALVATLFEERIRTRKPAAYLTQEAWLQGVPFYVDERAIVPRSFIAELLALRHEEAQLLGYGSYAEVSVVGDFEGAATATLITELFGGWTSRSPYARVPDPYRPTVPRVLRQPPPRGLLLSYGDSAINYALRFWIANPMDNSSICSEVNQAIWTAFAAAGIEIPYPQRVVYMR